MKGLLSLLSSHQQTWKDLQRRTSSTPAKESKEREKKLNGEKKGDDYICSGFRTQKYHVLLQKSDHLAGLANRRAQPTPVVFSPIAR